MATCKDCEFGGSCALLHKSDSQVCNVFTNKKDCVEVVRCCDCKHRQENPDIYNTCFLTCNLKHGLQGTIDPTDFCSYGKREDGAGE